MTDFTDLFEFSLGQPIESVQAEYQDKIYSYMEDYLKSSRPITYYRNSFRRAINDGFTYAFVAGWADAGASGGLTAEAQSWLNNRITQEIGYNDSLFVQLKALRDNEELTLDEKLEAAMSHAEGYANTLTGVYAQGKMMGLPERDGKWELGATEEHCSTCASLNGKTHPLSWYLKNGYIPQEAGSSTLECHGYHCDCRIVDPKTGEVLIP